MPIPDVPLTVAAQPDPASRELTQRRLRRCGFQVNAAEQPWGQTDAMARAGAVYEVVNTSTGEVLSRHRTRQAAIDTWRTQFTGVPVQVWRRTVPKGEVLIVEGTWHESHRPG